MEVLQDGMVVAILGKLFTKLLRRQDSEGQTF